MARRRGRAILSRFYSTPGILQADHLATKSPGNIEPGITAGAEQTISTTKYEVTGRGGKGRELLQRGQFTRVIPNEVENPPPLSE